LFHFNSQTKEFNTYVTDICEEHTKNHPIYHNKKRTDPSRLLNDPLWLLQDPTTSDTSSREKGGKKKNEKTKAKGNANKIQKEKNEENGNEKKEDEQKEMKFDEDRLKSFTYFWDKVVPGAKYCLICIETNENWGLPGRCRLSKENKKKLSKTI
jgi:hypothetical protein